MYNRMFNEEATKALEATNDIAKSLGHAYIGSEHILLAILADKETFAAKTLIANNVNYLAVKEKIEAAIGTGDPSTVINAELTPRTKKILELSLAHANQLGKKVIGLEHILLAIIAENNNIAARIISELSGDAAKIAEEIFKSIAPRHNRTASFAEGEIRPGEGSRSTDPLKDYSRDLTELARQGKIDPVIGREQEIERITQILSRRTKNNPCLIGEPGVGKTAVAEGLALKIVSGDIPENLKDKKLLSLDLTAIIAGTKYRGEFEDRIKQVIDAVKNSGEIILFIDELHTIIGAGGAEGAMDASNIMKPSLARGELQVIGATTIDEYRKHIEKDSALERRFQPITVSEPTKEQTIEILKGLRGKYEEHHNVIIPDETIAAAVNLSSRYITDRFLPDKAIDLIDEAASRVRISAYTMPADLKKAEERIKIIAEDLKDAIEKQDFEKAAKLRDERAAAEKEAAAARSKWDNKKATVKGIVTEEEIARIVTSWTKIPVQKLEKNEQKRLLNLEKELHDRVIGQNEAVTAVAKAIRRGRAGLKDPKRPVGSFIFLGPTGVGKTELSKALAESVFGDESSLIRVDMSEYMEKHAVSKMIGSPPGYVGFDEGGQLTEKVRRNPYSVILFDEIEKAHPDVFNIMLQILDDGVLTDNNGRKVDFKNTVIIMTSNVGARLITEKQRKLGFTGSEEDEQNADYENIRESVLGELKKDFKPEFLNRVDDIIVFRKLTEKEIKQIAVNMLGTVSKRLEEIGVSVKFEKSIVDMVAAAGFDDVYGARPLRRAIQTMIEDSVSESLLDGTVRKGNKYKAKAVDGKPVYYEA